MSDSISKPIPKVYSYLRFSSTPQSKGTSEKRQVGLAKPIAEKLQAELAERNAEKIQDDRAKQIAEKRNYEFDTTLSMADKGRSGFHGDHIKKGALGKFLEKVKSGEVAPGSILVVENIDRLSRQEPIKAIRDIVFGLLDKGITIVTCDPEGEYTKESVNDNRIWELVVHIKRAHDESKRKSELLKASWKYRIQDARDNRLTVTNQMPKWLKVPKRAKHEKIPVGAVKPHLKAPETIVAIFEMRNKGMSPNAITRHLNSTPGYWHWQNKPCAWHKSYVKKILTSRTVIGEYQPHKRNSEGKMEPIGEPIEKYFPVIVSPTLFNAVKKKIASDRNKGGSPGKGGKADQYINILRSIIKCGYCKGSIHVDQKTKPHYIGYCDTHKRGPTDCPKSKDVRYDEIEKLILDNCPDLNPDDILPNTTEQKRQCDSLQTLVHGLEQEHEDIGKKMTNLEAEFDQKINSTLRDRLNKRFTDFEARQKQIEFEVSKTRQELEAKQHSAKQVKNCIEAITALKKHLKDGGPEARMKMNAHLRELIDRIDVFSTGTSKESNPMADGRTHTKDKDYGAETFAEAFYSDAYDAGLVIEAQHRQFVKYVTKRLMSKEGRFIVVRFKGGGVVKLAPKDSLSAAIEWKKRPPLLAKTKPRKSKPPKLDWRPKEVLSYKQLFDAFEADQKSVKNGASVKRGGKRTR